MEFLFLTAAHEIGEWEVIISVFDFLSFDVVDEISRDDGLEISDDGGVDEQDGECVVEIEQEVMALPKFVEEIYDFALVIDKVDLALKNVSKSGE